MISDNQSIIREDDADALSALDSCIEEYNYGVAVTSHKAQGYFSGFIAQKILNFTQCLECIKLSQSDVPSSYDIYTDLSNEGDLIYPSWEVFDLMFDLVF